VEILLGELEKNPVVVHKKPAYPTYERNLGSEKG
jgi:hypothetical protein